MRRYRKASYGVVRLRHTCRYFRKALYCSTGLAGPRDVAEATEVGSGGTDESARSSWYSPGRSWEASCTAPGEGIGRRNKGVPVCRLSSFCDLPS